MYDQRVLLIISIFYIFNTIKKKIFLESNISKEILELTKYEKPMNP